MTDRSIHAKTHPAHLSVGQLRVAWRVSDEPTPAECVYDPELHVGPYNTIESAEQRAARESVARDVCATCPALLSCGLYALKVRPTSGIWAGRTPTELDGLFRWHGTPEVAA